MKNPEKTGVEIDPITEQGKAVATPKNHADSRILSAHHAINIVGKDIVGGGPQNILEEGKLTPVGEAYADLGIAIYQWQAEHASEHNTKKEDGTLEPSKDKRAEAIRGKMDIVNQKIEALVTAHLPNSKNSDGTLIITQDNAKKASADQAAIEAAKSKPQIIKDLFEKAKTDPKSALRISTNNIISKQVEVRAKSKVAIEPSKKFDFEWFQKERDTKQDNKPVVHDDGSVSMDALRTESDGELLGNAILAEKKFDPHATYTLDAEPFRTESGISFMPIAGTAGFMKKIRENGGKKVIHFGKGAPLTLASWAIDSKYNPTVVKNNKGALDGPTATYAVDRNENIKDGQKLEVELVINDAYNLVLADMASGKIDSIDPSNRAMINFAVLTKVDQVINEAKAAADKSFEQTKEKSIFYTSKWNPSDPAKLLKERVVHELTDNMSPAEKKQAALVVNTENGVQVTSGQSLTGTESTLSFDGKLQANSEPKSCLRDAAAYITQSASSAYGSMRGRESKMDTRTDKIMNITLPSEQAQKIGEDWANFNEKIDFDAASPQAIIQKQAARIHKNMEAAQAIRPLIGELDQNQEQQTRKELKIKDLEGKIKQGGGKEILDTIDNTKNRLETVKNYDAVKREQTQLQNDKEPIAERARKAQAALINPDHQPTPEETSELHEAQQELATHEEKQSKVDSHVRLLASAYGEIASEQNITGEVSGRLESVIANLQGKYNELVNQHDDLVKDNEELKTTQEELITLRQEGNELKGDVEKKLKELKVLENDQGQVVNEAQSDNKNAYEKLHKTTDENPEIKAYTTPKDTIQTAPQIAETITNVAKAAQAANMQISEVTTQAQKEFTTPKSSSTARESIDATSTNQNGMQPTPPSN